MADLPSIANRMNDIEISANAPVTESTNRKMGSNINALLDALGIANGGTGAGGDLADLLNAIALIESHTADLVASFTGLPSGGSVSIGNFGMTKFVNQVFTIQATAVSGFFGLFPVTPTAIGGTLVGSQVGFQSNASGSVNFLAPGTELENNSGSGLSGDTIISYSNGYHTHVQGNPSIRTRSRTLNAGVFNLAPQESFDAVELDYRDSSSISLSLAHLGGTTNQPFNIYRSYRLNIMSDIF